MPTAAVSAIRRAALLLSALSAPLDAGALRAAAALACPNASAAGDAGLLSVKRFGAHGDAVHDDAPAVRAAMRCLGYIGGSIFFPPGYYLVNSTIVVAD